MLELYVVCGVAVLAIVGAMVPGLLPVKLAFVVLGIVGGCFWLFSAVTGRGWENVDLSNTETRLKATPAEVRNASKAELNNFFSK